MTTLCARDVMTDSVILVSPESSLDDVLRVFVESNIHGAPVVDGDGQVVGSISTSDLLRAQEDERDTASAAPDYLRDLLEFSSPDWSGDLTDFQDRLAGRTAAEVMTKGLVQVRADDPIATVARALREHRVHRVWVESDGELCGVVSALDLMPVLEGMTSEG